MIPFQIWGQCSKTISRSTKLANRWKLENLYTDSFASFSLSLTLYPLSHDNYKLRRYSSTATGFGIRSSNSKGVFPGQHIHNREKKQTVQQKINKMMRSQKAEADVREQLRKKMDKAAYPSEGRELSSAPPTLNNLKDLKEMISSLPPELERELPLQAREVIAKVRAGDLDSVPADLLNREIKSMSEKASNEFIAKGSGSSIHRPPELLATQAALKSDSDLDNFTLHALTTLRDSTESDWAKHGLKKPDITKPLSLEDLVDLDKFLGVNSGVTVQELQDAMTPKELNFPSLESLHDRSLRTQAAEANKILEAEQKRQEALSESANNQGPTLESPLYGTAHSPSVEDIDKSHADNPITVSLKDVLTKRSTKKSSTVGKTKFRRPAKIDPETGFPVGSPLGELVKAEPEIMKNYELYKKLHKDSSPLETGVGQHLFKGPDGKPRIPTPEEFTPDIALNFVKSLPAKREAIERKFIRKLDKIREQVTLKPGEIAKALGKTILIQEYEATELMFNDIRTWPVKYLGFEPVDLDVLQTMLGMYSMLGNFPKAIEIFELIPSYGFNHDVISYNHLIWLGSTVGDTSLMETWFSKLTNTNIPPNVATFNGLLSGYALLGRETNALEIFDRMAQYSVEPNSDSYALIIHMYSVILKKHSSGAEWVRKLMESDLKRTDLTNTILAQIHRNISESKRSTALRKDEELRSSLQGQFISSAKSGLYDQAVNLWFRMKTNGDRLEEIHYNLLIRLYIENEKFIEALDIFKELKLAHKPSRGTLTMMIELFDGIGDTESSYEALEMLKVAPPTQNIDGVETQVKPVRHTPNTSQFGKASFTTPNLQQHHFSQLFQRMQNAQQ